MTALKKAGFNAQQRVRMLLQQPPTIESTLRVGDWHADSRLCYLPANDVAARGTIKGLSGNQWRMCSETGPDNWNQQYTHGSESL